MLKRSVLVVACAAVFGFAGVAQAQQRATLVLKSGERVTGQLVDLGARGFSVQMNGQLRRIPQGDVALIDFANAGGSASAEVTRQLNSGKHVVQLRSGETIVGNLYDISGKTPLKITMDTASGRRALNSSDISRIYLSIQSGATAATTGGTAAQPSVPGAIVVPSTQQWTPTGITVRRGEIVRFNSTGEIQLSGDANDKAQVAGALSGRKAPGAPLPGALAGALIGRIGNGEPFGIGNQTSIPMPASGPLYLGINDDGLGDNSGQFNVVITRPSRR